MEGGIGRRVLEAEGDEGEAAVSKAGADEAVGGGDRVELVGGVFGVKCRADSIHCGGFGNKEEEMKMRRKYARMRGLRMIYILSLFPTLSAPRCN